MAGGDHKSIRSDPAVERWSQMHASMYSRFRMTPRNASFSTAWALVVPAGLLALLAYSDVRYDYRGKRHGDELKYGATPAAAKESEE